MTIAERVDAPLTAVAVPARTPRAAEAPPARSFRTDIQGLRAVAVGLVLLYHAGVESLRGGYVGVDVFFVISGFLITSHLAEGLDRRGSVGFRHFYARRVRRILPVSFFVLAVTFVASLAVLPPLQIGSIVEDATATALYVPNVLFASRGTDYLAETAPTPFQHYWSLGIEEQFYLLWPLALFVLWRLARARRAVIATLMAGLVVASFVAGLAVLADSQPTAFFLLPTRAWELGVGGLVGLAVTWRAGSTRHRDGRPTGVDLLRSVLAAAAGWAGLGLVAWAALTYDADTRFPGWAAVVPVVGTAAVIGFGAGSPVGGPGRLLSVRPAQFVGRLSYSLYLWHWPLLVLGAAAAPDEPSLSARLGLVAAALPLSMASFRWIEEPLRANRRLALRPWLTIGLALATSALVVGAVTATGRWWDSRPLSTDEVVPEVPLTSPPRFTDVVPANLVPSLRSSLDDLPPQYDDDCHLDYPDTEPRPCTYGDVTSDRTVVLFGDSHAAHWSPALDGYARAHGLRLVTHTKTTCPSAMLPKRTLGNRYTACETWRDRVLEQLRADPPELIVLTNSRMHDPLDASVNPTTAWNAALAETLDALPSSSQAVVIADTPRWEEAPRLCLSAHLDDTTPCARPRAAAISRSWNEAQRRTALAHGAIPVDLNDHLCTDVCRPVIGHHLVYRDRNHLTASFSRALADPLAAALEEAGVTWD